MAKHFDDKFKKNFVEWFIEAKQDKQTGLSHREGRDLYWAEMGLPDAQKPSRSTIYRWINKFKDKIKQENKTTEDNMGEKDDKTKGKEAIDQQVIGSDVSQSSKESSGEKYTGGDNGSKTEEKEKKDENSQSGNSSEGLNMDLGKVSSWIGAHKVQLGLVLAGVAVVVLVSRFRTVNVGQLEGHGEGSNGDVGSDSDNPDEFNDEGAWTGE